MFIALISVISVIFSFIYFLSFYSSNWQNELYFVSAILFLLISFLTFAIASLSDKLQTLNEIHEEEIKKYKEEKRKKDEDENENKYPRVKTRGISYAGEALCYQPPSTRVLRSAICILLLERAIWIIYP